MLSSMGEHLFDIEEMSVDPAGNSPSDDLTSGCEHGDVLLEEVPVDIQSFEVVDSRTGRPVVAQSSV